MERFDIVIAGGGLSAAKTVESYRDAGGADSIVVLGGEPRVPYNRPPLSKRLLRGEIQPEETYVHDEAWYSEHGVDLRLGTHVQALDTAGRTVRADAGEFEYGRLVVATGSLPRPFPGAMTFRTVDDSLAVQQRAREEGKAVVIGTGFIGCEVSASLRALDVDVTLVTNGRPLFGSFRSHEFSSYLAKLYPEHGVRLSEQAVDGPLVVAGVGVEPALGWLEGSGIDVDNGVRVDERFEASVEGIYSIGDAARFYDPVLGYERRIEHWSNASYQGGRLGTLLAGEDTPFDTVSSFFTELFGHGFRVFGDVRGETELEGAFEEGRAIVRFRENGRLFGAITTGLADEEQEELKSEIRAGGPSG